MSVLPDVLDCSEFVNADEIAKGLSPFKPEEVAVEAGKLMLLRIDFLLSRHVTFAIETTLATRSYKKLVERAKAAGYQVILLFFWLSSPEMAEMRVAQRVASGGHDIPRDVIHRRYWAGLRNLFEIFVPIVDLWSLYDNTKELLPIVERSFILNDTLFTEIKKSCLNKKK